MIKAKPEIGDIWEKDSNGRISFEEAESYCIKRAAELQQKARQQAFGELPCITLDKAFGRYFQEKGQYLSLPAQRLSRLTKLKKDINVRYLSDIQEEEINKFISLNRNQLSNATINRYLYLLSAVLRTATEEWKVKTYPLKLSKFKLKEPAENIKYLKDWKTAQKIIDRAAPHLKPIIYTALYTGLREDIDFNNKMITLKVKDSTRAGGKVHTIPIVEPLKEILEKQPHINEYVFNYKGFPIKSISTAWRNIFYKRNNRKTFSKELKDPTLPYTNFHTLRHTAATWILKKTNNLRITKEILGHSNINTTLKYAHVLDEEKKNSSRFRIFQSGLKSLCKFCAKINACKVPIPDVIYLAFLSTPRCSEIPNNSLSPAPRPPFRRLPDKPDNSYHSLPFCMSSSIK